MHTLSDLGDGKAQDLARLCEIAHVGRLGPEEAAIVGALLGLPAWAVDTIPTLGPGTGRVEGRPGLRRHHPDRAHDGRSHAHGHVVAAPQGTADPDQSSR